MMRARSRWLGAVAGVVVLGVVGSKALDILAFRRVRARAAEMGVVLEARESELTLFEVPLESSLVRRYVTMSDATFRLSGTDILVRAPRVTVTLEGRTEVRVWGACLEHGDRHAATARVSEALARASTLGVGVLLFRGDAPCPESDAVGEIDPRDAGASAPDSSTDSIPDDKGAWPGEIDTIVFSQASTFVAFQDQRAALLVDVRGRRGIARASRKPYATTPPGWTTYGLPMELTPLYSYLRTVQAGELAVVGDGLEELATGRRIGLPDDATIFDAYAVQPTKGATRVFLYDGQTRELPPNLRALDGGDVLIGSVVNAPEKALVADPRSGRSITIDVEPSSVVAATWLVEDRSKLLVVAPAAESPDGSAFDLGSWPTTFRVLAFPSGSQIVEARSRGKMWDHGTSADRDVVGWVETVGLPPGELRCGVGMLDVVAARHVRSHLFPCRHEEFEPLVRLLAVDSARVVARADAVRSFDPRTGQPGAPPKIKRASTPVRRDAFAREFAELRKDRPDIESMAPLVRDGALLAQHHGYHVDLFGDADTVLVHRGDAHSICDAPLGEPCRLSFTTSPGDGDLSMQFSPNGERLAVVSDDRVLVLDGVSGELLFERPRVRRDAGRGSAARAR